MITKVQVPSYDGRNVWPAGMYTIDMSEGFHQMKDKRLRAAFWQPELFNRIFGVQFMKGTYHDNLHAWEKMQPDLQAQYEKAGRTPKGLWSCYLAARRAALGQQSKKSSGPKKLREG